MKGKHYKLSSKLSIIYIIREVFIITLIISIIYIVKWCVATKQNEKLTEKISEAIIIEDIQNEEKDEVKYKIDFEKLKKTNEETVAWLNVNGTNIQYPVVQAVDNNYYLNRNFGKEKNKAGWIFADYRNKLDGTDKNIIIYGHNMKDNSMFATLKNALNKDWYGDEQNLIIDFITEKENQRYKIFSVYEIESEDYYITTYFKNNEFIEFAETLRNRSINDFNVDVTANDSILTLSTCGDNSKYRIVVHAIKVNMEE